MTPPWFGSLPAPQTTGARTSRGRRVLLAALVIAIASTRASARKRHHRATREPSAPPSAPPSPLAPAPATPTILVQPQIAPPQITIPPPRIVLAADPWWKGVVAPAVALVSAIVSAGAVYFSRQTFVLSLARDLSTLLGQRAETRRALALQAFEHRVARPIGGALDTLEALLSEVRGLAANTAPRDAAAALLGFSVRAQLDLTTCQHRCRDADRTISQPVGAQPGVQPAAVFADALAASYPLEALIEAAQAALSGQSQAAVLNSYDRLVAQGTALQSTLRRLLETERNAEAERRTLPISLLPIYGELQRQYPETALRD